MILQFQQRFQCPAIALESKAAHQVGRFTGILCGQQRVDQALPHISGSVIIDLTGPEHPCGQRRPLDFRGDGVPVTQQLPEVGAFRFFCFAAICSGVQANAVFRSCSHLHFQHNPS